MSAWLDVGWHFDLIVAPFVAMVVGVFFWRALR